MAQFIDVKGEPTRERQNLSFVLTKEHAPTGTVELRPGPLRLTLENRTDMRTLPSIWVAGDDLHTIFGHRRPFLTANRLLSNQTFRDLYRTDTIDVDQRLKITSLTFLFTDLKGSTDSTTASATLRLTISCGRISGFCRKSSRPRPGPWSRPSATP